MNDKINWGILSTAKIGITHVIPAMKKGQYTRVLGIASRDLQKAGEAAGKLGIAKAYGSYEEMFADNEIDAIYNSLPNNLHVEYTIKALEAGKHVLCEKPIGMNAAEAQRLLDASLQYPTLKVMEAFMYRFHPQWQQARQIVSQGLLGEVRNIQAFFSYYNADPANIRNKPGAGGGGLMDIGCYFISFARFITGREPLTVAGMADMDPEMGTDRLTSAMLDMGNGISATFTCSTQLEPYQRIDIFGTKGRLEVEIPVNAIADEPARLYLQNNRVVKQLTTEAANQYTLQADEFSKAILNDTPVPTPLTDAVNNMKVIDAIVKSAAEQAWVKL